MSIQVRRTTPVPPGAIHRPSILVVDDATVVRLYYRQILEAEGLLGRGSDQWHRRGWRKCLQTPFDLCIVDVNMPMMDGYAFLHALRRDRHRTRFRL